MQNWKVDAAAFVAASKDRLIIETTEGDI